MWDGGIDGEWGDYDGCGTWTEDGVRFVLVLYGWFDSNWMAFGCLVID